jgi:hypothetical protein
MPNFRDHHQNFLLGLLMVANRSFRNQIPSRELAVCLPKMREKGCSHSSTDDDGFKRPKFVSEGSWLSSLLFAMVGIWPMKVFAFFRFSFNFL